MAAQHGDAVIVQFEGEGEGERTRLSNATGSGANDPPAGAEAAEEGFCAHPLTTIPYVTLLAGAVVVFILGMASFAAGSLIWPAGIIACVGSLGVGIYLCCTGGLRAELQRFTMENKRLEKTRTALEGDVDKLEVANQKVAVQVDKLEGTVDDLQGVSTALMKDLDAFSDLRTEMQAFAKETGANISEVLGNVNGVYDRMYGLTLENERALLQRVAQDLEFMDRDKSMSKMEFQRFLQRIPAQFRERFEASGLTFESVAGADQQIDFKEMGDLIDQLLHENADRQKISKQKSLAAEKGAAGQSS